MFELFIASMNSGHSESAKNEIFHNLSHFLLFQNNKNNFGHLSLVSASPKPIFGCTPCLGSEPQMLHICCETIAMPYLNLGEANEHVGFQEHIVHKTQTLLC